MRKKISGIRLLIQVCFTALSNGYVYGFAKGKIYTGKSKKLCLPGLNCYSCPGALGSCPLGSLQGALASGKLSFPFYVLGLITLFGIIFGRGICGFLCPFGLVQDLIYKIPFFKKYRSIPGHKYLKYIKYLILAAFVLALPLILRGDGGPGVPMFCKWICPSGTLFGALPLAAADQSIGYLLGGTFFHKLAILIALLLLSLAFYRPFCKYLCPLGALYGLFNRFSLFRLQRNENKCQRCKKCSRVCPMETDVFHNLNSAECIRCGKCADECPTQSLALKFGLGNTPKG